MRVWPHAPLSLDLAQDCGNSVTNEAILRRTGGTGRTAQELRRRGGTRRAERRIGEHRQTGEGAYRQAG